MTKVVAAVLAFILFLLGGLWFAGGTPTVRKKYLNFLTEKLTQSTPYRLKIESHSGNVLSDVRLNNVSLRVDNLELIHVAHLDLNVVLTALFRKHIWIHRLIFEDPEVRVLLNGDKELILPLPHRKKEATGKRPWLTTIDTVKIRGGELYVISLAAERPVQLRFSNIALDGRLEPKRFLLAQFEGRLSQGELKAKGDFPIETPDESVLELSLENFPIGSLLRLIFPLPESIQWTYQGRWQVEKKDGNWNAHPLHE